MVLGEVDTMLYLGRVTDDAKIAVEAAMLMAKRFNRTVVIQDNLEVVFAEDAKREILEIIRPPN